IHTVRRRQNGTAHQGGRVIAGAPQADRSHQNQLCVSREGCHCRSRGSPSSGTRSARSGTRSSTMKARLTLDKNARRRGRAGLRALEWFFLIAGLAAIDCFVWINTSSVLYQAYQDWAFDQTLRGLKPGLGGFIRDEADWLFHPGREKGPVAEAPPTPKQSPGSGPVQTPPAPRSVIGRLAIPRLKLAVMVREGA